MILLIYSDYSYYLFYLLSILINSTPYCLLVPFQDWWLDLGAWGLIHLARDICVTIGLDLATGVWLGHQWVHTWKPCFPLSMNLWTVNSSAMRGGATLSVFFLHASPLTPSYVCTCNAEICNRYKSMMSVCVFARSCIPQSFSLYFCLHCRQGNHFKLYEKVIRSTTWSIDYLRNNNFLTYWNIIKVDVLLSFCWSI